MAYDSKAWGVAGGAVLTHETARQAVDQLVRKIHASLGSGGGGVTVNEVFEAGSLGQGTAVRGDFDVDLVIYSTSVESKEVLSKGYAKYLEVFKEFFLEKFGDRVEVEKVTEHAVQFKYNDEVDVDVLVSYQWATPQEPGPEKLYQFLRTIPEDKRFTFSVGASRWQVDFVRHQPNQAKEFVMRAKAWRNSEWRKEKSLTGRPKSYLMTILVVRAYEKAAIKVGTGNTRKIAEQTTAEMKSIVTRHDRSDIYWEKYYKKCEYPDLFPRCIPRIVDPANPANNLYETGIGYHHANNKCRDYEAGDGDWRSFKGKIETLDLTKTVEEIQQLY